MNNLSHTEFILLLTSFNFRKTWHFKNIYFAFFLAKTIQISDITGRVVLNHSTSDDLINLNVSNLANGVYYVKVLSNNRSDVMKIVKQ